MCFYLYENTNSRRVHSQQYGLHCELYVINDVDDSKVNWSLSFLKWYDEKQKKLGFCALRVNTHNYMQNTLFTLNENWWIQCFVYVWNVKCEFLFLFFRFKLDIGCVFFFFFAIVLIVVAELHTQLSYTQIGNVLPSFAFLRVHLVKLNYINRYVWPIVFLLFIN